MKVHSIEDITEANKNEIKKYKIITLNKREIYFNYSFKTNIFNFVSVLSIEEKKEIETFFNSQYISM